MDKNKLAAEIVESGVVAIVRLDSTDNLIKVAAAIAKGGVRHIEFTMSMPGALDIIKQASAEFGDDVVMGAGTVLDPETARACILAGAKFVVAPSLNVDMIEICNRYSVVSMPGAFTPTEILAAWDAGADVVKVFPASQVGPGYIKAVKAPFPQVKLAPVGGVTLENASEWIRMGSSCLGVGSALVNSQLIADGNWQALTDRAKGFIDGVQAGRA